MYSLWRVAQRINIKDKYLINRLEKISPRNKLHDEEESFLGLKSCKKSSEELAIVAKSEDLPLKESDGGAVLAQNVPLADRLDCTHLLVRDPFCQENLQFGKVWSF